MSKKASLRYPLHFDANIPFIHFKAFKYVCPEPELKILNGNHNEKTEAPGIPQVALYMPGDFSENVNAQWAPEDVFQGAGSNWYAGMISNTAEYVGKMDDGKLAASIKAHTGKMPFPMDINIFRAVDPMQFTLNFNMIPYDKAEADAIVSIVKLFKQQILPTSSRLAESFDSTKNTLLSFPNVWDITFYNIKGLGLEGANALGTTNMTESKYELMSLTNCNVSYVSGTEGASVYSDGNPTQVRLSISFQSLRKQYIIGEPGK